MTVRPFSRLFIFAIFGIVLLSSSAFAAGRWELQWNDEFDGSSLNTSKWDIEVNCWGGGNNEKQCYTNRASNVFVSGGALHLRPIAGTYQGSNAGCTLNNENSCTWTQPATSGRVRTLNAVDGSWKYGRFEVRARLPKGNFLWPAIWMLPTDNVYGTWAASGEIDIMEARGQEPTKVSSAIHYGAAWPNNVFTTSGDMNFDFDFTSDFHIFTLEWDSSALRFFVDNRLTWTQSLQKKYGSIYTTNGAPFDQKFHLLLNVAVAGGFFDPARYGNFDINSASPTWTQDMAIDYVRVWKWTEDSATVPPPVTSTPIPNPSPITPPTNSPSCSSGLSVPLFPVSDSYTDASRATTSFGSDCILSLRRSTDPTQTRQAYLKFFIPPKKLPTRAVLSMYGASDEGTGNVNVFIQGMNTNQWTEQSITAQNAPARCISCSSASVSVGTTMKWHSWNVLPIIKSQLDAGNSVVSVMAMLTSRGSATFNSNDAPNNQPILQLYYQ